MTGRRFTGLRPETLYLMGDHPCPVGSSCEHCNEARLASLRRGARRSWAAFWVVLVFLTIAFAAVANAQGILPASTGCVGDPGEPLTLFRPDIERDPIAKAELEAHEAVHREQLHAAMARGQSCYVALADATSNARKNLEWEAPAYLAQADWNQTHRLGFDRRDYVSRVARALFDYYGHAIPIGEIFIALQGSLADTPWGQVEEPMSRVFQ